MKDYRDANGLPRVQQPPRRLAYAAAIYQTCHRCNEEIVGLDGSYLLTQDNYPSECYQCRAKVVARATVRMWNK